MIDRTPNKDAGSPVKGQIFEPEVMGVYQVKNDDTGEDAALLVFQNRSQKLQILLDENDVTLMVVALTELQVAFATKSKPTNLKGLN